MFTETIRRLTLAAVLLSAAAPTLAAPSLQVEGEQYQKPASISLSPIQLWDTTWWLVVQAQPDGAPLARIEYRTRFLDDRPQPKAGGIELKTSSIENAGGRIAIRLPTRDDYDRKLEARVRVQDAAGNDSDWVIVQFPPEKRRREPRPGDYVSSPILDGQRRHRVLGTVEYEATDSTSIGVVREQLGRQAKAKGGDAAVGVRLASGSGDAFVFVADVIRYLEEPKATASPAPLATDRELGEIVVSYERQ